MNTFGFCFAFLTTCSLFLGNRLESEFLWTIIQPLEETEELSSLIQARIVDIRALNESWRPFVKKEAQRNLEFLNQFWPIFSTGTLSLNHEGAAAAYTLYDSFKDPCFIIKPTDECVFCLHNPKHYASPFEAPPHHINNHIPLYRSAQTEAFCYELAKICKLEDITPQTVLALLSHPQFFYLNPESETLQIPDKLCSIQKYLKGTFPLRKILQELFTFHLSEEELQNRFDQKDFEDLSLFLWLTADTDAHVGNFRAYLKNISLEGYPIYGLKKIDNSLSFPEINTGITHPLMYFPNALLPLSSRTRLFIKSLPLQEIHKMMSTFRLESAYPAFEERVFTLQKIIEIETITYYECSLRLTLLATNEGKGVAIKNCSLKLLEYLAKDILKPQVFIGYENN